MAEAAFKRKQIYINMDLQFKYSLVLIFTMFIELVIVGLALLYVFSRPTQQGGVPGENIYFIYEMVLAIILFLTLCNITVGVYLSHKIAGPLYRFVMCARELANGNLKIQVNLRKGDELRELESAFNDMTDRLRAVIRQDRQHLKDIQEAVAAIETAVNKSNFGKGEKDKVLEEIKFVQEASEKITSHFSV